MLTLASYYHSHVLELNFMRFKANGTFLQLNILSHLVLNEQSQPFPVVGGLAAPNGGALLWQWLCVCVCAHMGLRRVFMHMLVVSGHYCKKGFPLGQCLCV